MRLNCGFVVLLWAASLAAAGDFIGAEYYFPIVTRTGGLGGTDWFTEVSLANPQAGDLVITVRVAQDDARNPCLADIRERPARLIILLQASWVERGGGS